MFDDASKWQALWPVLVALLCLFLSTLFTFAVAYFLREANRRDVAREERRQFERKYPVLKLPALKLSEADKAKRRSMAKDIASVLQQHIILDEQERPRPIPGSWIGITIAVLLLLLAVYDWCSLPGQLGAP